MALIKVLQSFGATLVRFSRIFENIIKRLIASQKWEVFLKS